MFSSRLVIIVAMTVVCTHTAPSDVTTVATTLSTSAASTRHITSDALSHRLKSFLGFVYRGFVSVGTSVRTLRDVQELETARLTKLTVSLENALGQLDKLNTSVARLERLEKEIVTGTRTTPTSAPSPATECEAGWKKFAGRCYKMWPCDCSANYALSACAKLGANLTRIRDWQERDFLIKEMGKRDTWLGGNDRVTEGEWRWQDGALVQYGYTKWAYAEPTSRGADTKDCMYSSVGDGQKWRSYQCWQNKDNAAVACEKPL